MGGGIDARWRGSVGQLVQLCPSGGAGAASASVTEIRAIVDAALARLDADFAAIYAPIGRPSIPPEQLLRGLLLQAFYSVRSERQLMEQLDYNLLFRWFVGLGIDDPVWDVTVFTNRDRLLGGEIASKFFGAVLDDARVEGLLSCEHFSVDGTLIQAWASLKSFRPKDGSGELPAPGRNGERDFKGEKRSNETTATRHPGNKIGSPMPISAAC